VLCLQWFRVSRHAVISSLISLLWLYGLTLCGPLRLVWLYIGIEWHQHWLYVIMLAVFASHVLGSAIYWILNSLPLLSKHCFQTFPNCEIFIPKSRFLTENVSTRGWDNSPFLLAPFCDNATDKECRVIC